MQNGKPTTAIDKIASRVTVINGFWALIIGVVTVACSGISAYAVGQYKDSERDEKIERFEAGIEQLRNDFNHHQNNFAEFRGKVLQFLDDWYRNEANR